MKEYIVAEVSKNWPEGPGSMPGILSQRFEQVITVNAQRGYTLASFALHQIMTKNDKGEDVMNETIIAVFEREAR